MVINLYKKRRILRIQMIITMRRMNKVRIGVKKKRTKMAKKLRKRKILNQMNDFLSYD
jgi:hypothetical protein